MAYVYDESQAQQNDFSLVEEGMYEVKIELMSTKTTPNGKEAIAVRYRIRDDIDQKFQNRVLFEDIWKERKSDYYNRKRLNQLMGTQHFPDGKTFGDIYEVMDELQGRFLQVKVVIEHNDYTGKDENKIAFYSSTDHGPQELGEEDDTSTTEGDIDDIEVEEDDLPF